MKIRDIPFEQRKRLKRDKEVRLGDLVAIYDNTKRKILLCISSPKQTRVFDIHTGTFKEIKYDDYVLVKELKVWRNTFTE